MTLFNVPGRSLRESSHCKLRFGGMRVVARNQLALDVAAKANAGRGANHQTTAMKELIAATITLRCGVIDSPL